MELADLWNFITTYPEISAALLTFLMTAVWQLTTRVFAARPKVIWGMTSNHTFLVPWVPPAEEENPKPRTNILKTRNIWVFNGGTSIAEEVELVFNWEPEHIERFPVLPAQELHQKDGRYVISITRLNPKEGVNFSLLSLNNELPILTHVRCKGHSAKYIEFINQRRYPSWALWLVGVTMVFGVAAIFYLLIQLAIWIA